MSETIQIPASLATCIHRMLTRIDVKLNREELKETINEQEAADFLECKRDKNGSNIRSFRRLVETGTIPRNAYIVLRNNKKRFYKHRLIK